MNTDLGMTLKADISPAAREALGQDWIDECEAEGLHPINDATSLMRWCVAYSEFEAKCAAPFVKAGRVLRQRGRRFVAGAKKTPKLARAMVEHRSDLGNWAHDRINRESAISRGLPWISYPALRLLEDVVKPGMRVFEWGSGGSTVFFARKGCRVTSIESSEVWHGRLESGLSVLTPEQRSNVDLRFIKAHAQEYPQGLDAYVSSVLDGGPWDLILVDGWERVRCAETAQVTLAPDGILIFDNSDQPQFASVRLRLQETPFPGFGVSRIWPTQTSVYR